MSLILGKAMILVSPISYDLNISQYCSDFVNSFRLIKSSLPDNRNLIKLEKGETFSDKKNHYYFIDYTHDETDDASVVDVKLSEEIIKEIHSDEEFENLYSEDVTDGNDD